MMLPFADDKKLSLHPSAIETKRIGFHSWHACSLAGDFYTLCYEFVCFFMCKYIRIAVVACVLLLIEVVLPFEGSIGQHHFVD